MADKKVISIRFHTESKEDMELYRQLELEAGTSLSLAAVVKVKLKEIYHQQIQSEENNRLQEKMMAFIREEMQTLGMKLVGAILSGMGGTGERKMTSSKIEEDNLPEKSAELPSGALEFLE